MLLQAALIVHIFPPCDFSSAHLSQKAPELMRSLDGNFYLAIVITPT